ncbi:hypothetical protein OS493_002675 [Desmophyllum pertusum]|uniref:CUB domain-containing protein n=1 Tax=Desmophyllum pertusum TaxID=174260 RepID=A0A9W9YTF6_9CNID|nr:hypothetical protein OS493_002659 [Desmophyllum pertusum]KAJ7365938.1 hypothetical protein OS493_002675 [Desmophyllum pertusum]
MWNEEDGVFASQECGSVVNNTLKSPGYPENYPRNMDCNYTVPIPPGMMLEIYASYFHVGDLEYPECSEVHDGDYVKLSNENKILLKACGWSSGQSSDPVTGNYAVITFHSDNILGNGGRFLLIFTMLHCEPLCSKDEWNIYLSCLNITSTVHITKCAPTFTKNM